jgi:hypothetical protein
MTSNAVCKTRSTGAPASSLASIRKRAGNRDGCAPVIEVRLLDDQRSHLVKLNTSEPVLLRANQTRHSEKRGTIIDYAAQSF